MIFPDFLEKLKSNSIQITLYCELYHEAIVQFNNCQDEHSLIPFKRSKDQALDFVNHYSGDVEGFLKYPWDENKNLYELEVCLSAETNPIDNTQFLKGIYELMNYYNEEFENVKAFEDLNDLICTIFFGGGHYDLYCDDLEIIEYGFFNRLFEIDSPGYEYSKVSVRDCEINQYWLEFQPSNHIELRVKEVENN